MDFTSYCAEYYLLSDTKTTRYVKQHPSTRAFWLIHVHVISCTLKPLCVHVAWTLVTVRAICGALDFQNTHFSKHLWMALNTSQCAKVNTISVKSKNTGLLVWHTFLKWNFKINHKHKPLLLVMGSNIILRLIGNQYFTNFYQCIITLIVCENLLLVL